MGEEMPTHQPGVLVTTEDYAGLGGEAAAAILVEGGLDVRVELPEAAAGASRGGGWWWRVLALHPGTVPVPLCPAQVVVGGGPGTVEGAVTRGHPPASTRTSPLRGSAGGEVR